LAEPEPVTGTGTEPGDAGSDRAPTQDRRRGDKMWAAFALPGVAWLCLFFLLPLYVILGIAFGSVDPIFQSPRPEWSPLAWNTSSFEFVLDGLFGGGGFQRVFLRTLVYVTVATALSLAIAYPVAYYVARYGGRWKGLLLAGLVAPFFISYLMRMLAWINLLQDDGWVNDLLMWVGIMDAPRNWLDGRASSVILGLVYGYVPFMILPLYAFLDRIDRALLEAARDLGASPWQAFRLVTLPLSKAAILASIAIIALPMFGDYYTTDMLSQSPQTSMIGNQINLYIRGGQQIPVGAALVVVLMLFLAVFIVYYLVATTRAQRRVGA
jgi:putrescine transport system permease protein